ncbi:hypothetical protein EVG20_g8650 [Dentipellis fragilis]|uniref:FAD-binding domain-containing protein n=1 Tax=Dentipellis fragilis TaxID=205917 RepID=A0A4Y9Y5H2_9AGAM|nr:hypothetical protein EVG20_g8650 [Dentipellis fragilis]
MSSTSVDVLIVGSGPTGLVTALTLAQNGVSVRVVEKLPYFPRGQRGSGIMPRTLEVYQFLGCLEDVKTVGIPPVEYLQWVDGKPAQTMPVMVYEEPTPAIPERNYWLLGQDAACRILRDHLKMYGVEVEVATQLVSLDQTDEQVVGRVVKSTLGEEIEEEITAKYVVGADGAKGVVRKLLGLTFLGETRDAVRVLIGDIEAWGLDHRHWHKFGDAPQDGFMLRPSDRGDENIFFLACFGPNLDYVRALTDHDYLREFMYNLSHLPDLKLGKVESVGDYRPSIRLANSFRKGRAFIAGDAAHVHSVTGGQGMNSSIMDAFNLGWKLALACKGLASPILLDTYDTERVPVIKEMLERTTAILNSTYAKEKPTKVSPWLRPTQLKQLGVHYRWSPIVLDEQVDELGTTDKDKARQETASTYVVEDGDRLHAGDRAPDAPGLIDIKSEDARRLFEIYRPEYHTVLIFSASDGTTVDAVLAALEHYPKGLIRSAVIRPQRSTVPAKGADLVLQDKETYAYNEYGMKQDSTGVAVVRPDGIIGALVGGAPGIKKYFSGIFSA